MKKLFIFCLVLIALILIGYLAYSFLFKKTTDIQLAKDFLSSQSVTISDAEVDEKLEWKDTVIAEGNKEFDVSLDETLCSSLINYWSSVWSRAPINSSSITIDGNVVKYTGKLNVSNAIKYLQIANIPQDVIDKGYEIVKPFGANLPISTQGTIEINNNVVVLDIQSISVAYLPIPTEIITQYTPNLESMVNTELKRDNKHNVKSLKIENGNILFKGTLPSKIVFK